MYKRIPPLIKPENTTNQVINFNSLAISIAGLSSEKIEAANIIPADNANIASKILLLTDLKKNTKLDPKTVIRKVNNPAKSAWYIGLNSLKKLINLYHQYKLCKNIVFG